MSSQLPLSGLRVLELATVFAGPYAGALLADYGADVIKVEHPDGGDAVRNHGMKKNGVGLWWKSIARNKRSVTLDLHLEDDKATFLELSKHADVLIENFRPGVLDRWGLDYERLSTDNPGLVVARVTGFGQTGPRARDAGFGTLAEAMSGFAELNGDPSGPPMLPPVALGDHMSGMALAFAIMVALKDRDRTGLGQEIDLAIMDAMLVGTGPAVSVFDQLGVNLTRSGNRSANHAPRNIYRTRDDRWLAMSAATPSIARRILRLVGAEEELLSPAPGEDEQGRLARLVAIDTAVGTWIRRRDAATALHLIREAQGAVALVQRPQDVLVDEQYLARGSIATVEDQDLGPLRMPNVLFQLSRTPGSIRWTGPDLGADNDSVMRWAAEPDLTRSVR